MLDDQAATVGYLVGDIWLLWTPAAILDRGTEFAMHADPAASGPLPLVAAAAEQIYDELLARVWALRSVVAVKLVDESAGGLEAMMANAAGRLASGLEAGSVTVGDVARMLWPVGPPPPPLDGWWRTPLGRLMTAVARDEPPTHLSPFGEASDGEDLGRS